MITKGKSGRSDETDQGVDWKTSAPPLAHILHERRDQHYLCGNLELLADQLPENVDAYLCERIYEKLRHDLPVYHRDEEALFDLISRNAPAELKVPQIVSYVCKEHAVHGCYADELCEPLQLLRVGADVENFDTIGYMLRCCFEAMRHHLQWEDLTLMPLAEPCLTAEDLDSLSAAFAENRKNIGLSIV